MKTLAELRARYDEIGAEIRTILEGAENGVVTQEMDEQISALKEERKGVLRNIDTRLALQEEERSLPKVDPSKGQEPKREERATVEVGSDRWLERGFTSLGEQARAVQAAAAPGAEPDRRLLHIQAEHRAATGMSESVAADGGFLVQKELAAGILERMFSTGEILSRVDTRALGANSNGMKLNQVDSDSRADGSRYGGLQHYWLAEAAQFQASQMKFRRMELELHKIAGLVYATEELLSDATALDSEIRSTVPEELRFGVESAIVNGSGVGRPLGFTQTSAYLSVAKDGSQAADTVVAKNVADLWGRMIAGSFGNAVWLVDQTVLPQLPLMTVGDQPVWTPNFQVSPNGALFGRPIIAHEHGVPVGEPGDIILADLSKYLLITKGGVREDVSMHVRFLYDEMAFRFIWRVDGQPKWQSPLTPKSGGATQSHFLTVASRT